MRHLAWPYLAVSVGKPIICYLKVILRNLAYAPLGLVLLRVVQHGCIILLQVERISEFGSRSIPGDLGVVMQKLHEALLWDGGVLFLAHLLLSLLLPLHLLPLLPVTFRTDLDHAARG